MKKNWLFLCVFQSFTVWGCELTNDKASNGDVGALVNKKSELEKMTILDHKNGLLLATKALCRGTGEVIENAGKDLILSGVHVRSLNLLRGIGCLVRIPQKPVWQLWELCKNFYFANPDRAAEREMIKLAGLRMGINMLKERECNQLYERIRSGKFFAISTIIDDLIKFSAPEISTLDHYYNEQAQYMEPKSVRMRDDLEYVAKVLYSMRYAKMYDGLYNAKFDAAKVVAQQASLKVRLFQRAQLKRAMKEAIQKVTPEEF